MSEKHLEVLHRHKRLVGAHNVNANEVDAEAAGLGSRISDSIANAMGSWYFVIIQTGIIACWVTLNVAGFFVWHWDPFPFIFLNLAFSAQAAYATPLIMMSQNRQATKDHVRAELDLHVNQASFSKLEEHSRVLEAQNQELLGQTSLLKGVTVDLAHLANEQDALDVKLTSLGKTVSALQKKANGA